MRFQIPGRPHGHVSTAGDDGPSRADVAAANARGLFRLLDDSPDNLAVFSVPRGAPLAKRAAILDAISDMIERARAERDLDVSTYNRVHPDFSDAAMMFVVHEHQWQDGACTACHEPQLPPADDDA